jgi:hypothetical protein
MKRTITFVAVLFIAISISRGQDDKSPTVKFLNKRGYYFQKNNSLPDSLKQWPDTLYYNTSYKAKLLGTPTIPISCERVELVNGVYQLIPSLNLGFGYTWFFGDFIFSENDKIIIDPGFSFGVMGNIGIQSNFNLSKPAGLFAGGFFGIQAITIFAGYDFLVRSPILGIGARVDLFTLSQNFLKPIGKVTEKKKHKKHAILILDE